MVMPRSLVHALASAQFALPSSRYRIPTLTLPLVFDETLRLSKPSIRYNIDHSLQAFFILPLLSIMGPNPNPLDLDM